MLRFSQRCGYGEAMPTVSDRVRELITRSGLTQREFAEHIGLDNSKLSKSLGGARRFSSLDLARMAEFYTVSVDWLLTGNEPALALAARTSAATNNGTAIGLARRLTGLRDDLAFLGYARLRPQSVGPAGRGLDTDQGERLAASALGQLAGVSLDDLPAAIETVFGIDVAVLDLGPKFDGLSVSAAAGELILLARGVPPWRQRFTLAHELGHLLAGDDQGLHVDEDIRDRDRQRMPTERRANAFAAAFLMPEPVLRSAVGSAGLSLEGFAALVCELRVSPSALAYRLLTFRLVDAMTGDRFKAMSAQEAAVLAGRTAQLAADLEVAHSNRIPGLLAADAYTAYTSGQATLRPYANLLGVDVDQLRLSLESEAGDERP